MGKRGIGSIALEGLEQKDKNRIIKSIITKSPQRALDIINSEKLGVEARDFFLEEVYSEARFPFLRYAYASARAENTVTPNGIIRTAVEFDLDKVCESRIKRFFAKTLFRWSFYIGGIAFLDIHLLPQLLSQSDYLLGSPYFDYFEMAPLAIDLSLGLGVWGAGFKHAGARKLEPYKYLPMPLIGYWIGRSAKRILQFSLHVIGLSLWKAAKMSYWTLGKYCELRLYGFRKGREGRVQPGVVTDRRYDLQKWSAQKSLIDHWLQREPAGSAQRLKAEALFRSIVAYAVENKEKAHLALIVNSLSYAQLSGLLRLLSGERICEMVSLLDKNKAAKVFVLLSADKVNDFLSLGRLSKEHEKILLSTLSSREAVNIFEKLMPDRAAELLSLLPDSVEGGEVNVAGVLFDLNPEKALAILRNIKDKGYLAKVCIPALGTKTKLEILSASPPLKGAVKEMAKIILSNLKVDEAIKFFEEIDARKAPELLAFLPRFTTFKKVSVAEIVNKVSTGKLFRILQEIGNQGDLPSFCFMNLDSESKYKLMKYIFSSGVEGGEITKVLLDALSPEQVAKLLSEIGHKKAVECTSFLFSNYKFWRGKLKKIMANVNEGNLLEIIGGIKFDDLIGVYLEDFMPEQRIKLLEYLPPERAVKILGASMSEEISQAAVAGISRAAALKILAKLSSRKRKVDFLKAHCGFDKSEIFKALNEYVCEDGLRILIAFCEEFSKGEEVKPIEPIKPFREVVQDLSKQFSNDVLGMTHSEGGKYAALAEASYHGISSDNFKRFMGYLNAEEFRLLVLTAQNIQVLTYAVVEAPPLQLIKLAEDYAAGRLPEKIATLIFDSMHEKSLAEVIKGLSFLYVYDFYGRLPDSKKRYLLGELTKDKK
jgi:Mg/Co/Ni transporter MgtE